MARSFIPLLAVACTTPVADVGRGVVGGADSGAPAPAPANDARTCGLVALADAEAWVEGETVTVEVACALEPDAIDQIDVLGLPDGATWSPSEGRLTWPTDGADAGTWRLTFAAPGGGGVPETRVVELPIVDDPEAPGAAPPDPERYVEEWGLPVIHIDPERELNPSKTDARLTIAGHGIDGTAKLRGATSLAYPKNSFTLDFEGEEAELEGWGDRSRGHMVLISGFDDNSYVRQKLVFDTWAAMAEAEGDPRLTPRTAFVVVYLSGVYHGLYIACDRIDDEFARHMGLSGDSELYKAVSHDANYDVVDEDGAPKEDLAQGWEKKEGEDLEDFDSLRALTAFVGAATPGEFAGEGDDWLHLDEFIDWWILVTWTLAEDSAGKNHYLFVDPEDGRGRFVPWDFNASYGQSWKTKRYDADLVRDHTEHNRAFRLLWEDPGLRERATLRLERLSADGGPLTADWQLDQVAAYYERIGPAVERDEARWGEAYREFNRWRELRDSRDDWNDAAGERAYVEAWIAARPDGMGDWPRTLP